MYFPTRLASTFVLARTRLPRASLRLATRPVPYPRASAAENDPQTKPGAPATVDVEAGVRPRENALGPLRAQEPFTDKKRQDLPAEDLGQPRVVQTRKPVEDPRPVHAALGQQEMQVRVEVDPIPEGLDSNNDAGDELFSHQGLKIDREGLDG